MSTPKGKQVLLALGLVFFCSLALDQISKWHTQKSLLLQEDPDDNQKYLGTHFGIGSIGERNPKESSFYFGLKFQYARNTGAAFSMGANWPDHLRVPFFYAVSFGAMVLICYLFYTLPFNEHYTRLGLSFIASGAIGNLIDRLHYGYVVDFIDVSWQIHRWYHDFAIFNIADVAINIGLYLIIIQAIVNHRREKKQKKETAAAQDAQETAKA